MFSLLDSSLFIMPVCYHPTTVLSVDDDAAFLQILSLKVSKTLPLLCFSSPEEALTYTKQKHHYFPFTSRCLTETNEGMAFNFLNIRR
jgi:hypothetical protein